MYSFAWTIDVFSQIKITFAVFFRLNLQSIVKKSKQMSFQSIYLKGSVRTNHFGKGVVLQTLIVPYLRSLYQTDQDYVLPVFGTDSLSLRSWEYPFDVREWNDRRLFLHATSHHDELNEIFNVLATAASVSLVLVAIVKARQVLGNRLQLIIERLLCLSKWCFLRIWAANRYGLVHTVI